MSSFSAGPRREATGEAGRGPAAATDRRFGPGSTSVPGTNSWRERSHDFSSRRNLSGGLSGSNAGGRAATSSERSQSRPVSQDGTESRLPTSDRERQEDKILALRKILLFRRSCIQTLCPLVSCCACMSVPLFCAHLFRTHNCYLSIRSVERW